MKIDDVLIDKIASLAKLEFTGPDREDIKKDLEKMVDFIDHLNEIDTEGTEPLMHIHTSDHPFRADEEKQKISLEEALKNAPDHDTDYFRVPRVLDK